jgi:hypothetical protein
MPKELPNLSFDSFWERRTGLTQEIIELFDVTGENI